MEIEKLIFRRYIKTREIEWDETKNAGNQAKHGLDFTGFHGFDSVAATVEDTRYEYGEQRWITLGRIDGVPHAIVYTLRGSAIRLIGFRRAHEQEIGRHEQSPSPT